MARAYQVCREWLASGAGRSKRAEALAAIDGEKSRFFAFSAICGSNLLIPNGGARIGEVDGEKRRGK
jgi:hypothetical protein